MEPIPLVWESRVLTITPWSYLTDRAAIKYIPPSLYFTDSFAEIIVSIIIIVVVREEHLPILWPHTTLVSKGIFISSFISIGSAARVSNHCIDTVIQRLFTLFIYKMKVHLCILWKRKKEEKNDKSDWLIHDTWKCAEHQLINTHLNQVSTEENGNKNTNIPLANQQQKAYTHIYIHTHTHIHIKVEKAEKTRQQHCSPLQLN